MGKLRDKMIGDLQLRGYSPSAATTTGLFHMQNAPITTTLPSV